MLRRTFLSIVASSAGSLASFRVALAQSASETATPAPASAETGYVTVNGLEMYYERHGTGEPLVLLHGGLMTIGLFGPLLTDLAATRQVIAVELEGHGHTPLLDRPLTYEQMADDVAALIDQLGIEQTDVFGYSLGGGVAWQLAIRRPELVRKLVVASAPFRSDGWEPVVREAMAGLNAEAAEAMVETPLYQAYAGVAANPDDWPELVTKVGQLASGAAEDYNWSEDVQAIAAPTLIIVGDADSVNHEQTLELFRLRGGGVIGDFAPLPAAQLAVLPGTAHSAVLSRNDLLIPIVIPFLDAPMPDDA